MIRIDQIKQSRHTRKMIQQLIIFLRERGGKSVNEQVDSSNISIPNSVQCTYAVKSNRTFEVRFEIGFRTTSAVGTFDAQSFELILWCCLTVTVIASRTGI